MDDTKPKNWGKIEDDFNKGQAIVLFLGTGVDIGAPKNIDYSWDALLSHLLKYAVNQITYSGEKDIEEKFQTTANKIIKKTNYEDNISAKDFRQLKKQITLDSMFPRDVKSTIVKQTVGNEVYVKLIQAFLYGQMDKQTVIQAANDYVEILERKGIENNDRIAFHSLFSVADLILRNRNIRAVVTQNYDQFLYEALVALNKNTNYHSHFKKKHNIDIRNIIPNIICDWKGQKNFTYDNFNIYHVHGYIPRYEEIQAPKNNKIVLSMDEFYEDSRNVYSWQIASQLHFLSQYTCIFCGLSLDDYTNQRLLHYVKGKHKGNLYYLSAHIEGEDMANERIKNKFHEKNGLTVLYDVNGYEHLYKLLGELQYKYNEKQ